MLIYGYRSKKCSASTCFYTSQKNIMALYNYNQDLFNNCDNQDIENSIDSKCRSIYGHLKIWYKRLTNNPNSLDDIKWKVVRTMKYYEKQDIYTISSINLKRNYYDFVI